MFASALMMTGKSGTLYDAFEANPVAINYYSSRARSLRMLGTVRANIDMFWIDPSVTVSPGMVFMSARQAYYLVIKVEQDDGPWPGAYALTALNTLRFSQQISGNSYAPPIGVAPNVYNEYPGGLTATPKTIRVIFDTTTDLFEESTAGVLPSGTIVALTATGSGVAMNDEYVWNGQLWRVMQVNPAEAAAETYGIQVQMKQVKPQQRQVT